jgi:seryl-tRNA synthetase
MVTKRRENGFNLAFLDVMACGLGAVLLILIIVNFNDDTPIPSDEIERLKQELAATQTQSQSLNSSISDQQQETSTQEANADTQAQKIAQLKILQKGLQQAIADKQAVIAELEDAIAAAAPLVADDPLAVPNVNEETYGSVPCA